MPLLLVCLALGALSLLTPSAPTYDPWSWIIWGREITQDALNTVEGPSWKPLPVFLTVPFALAGEDAAPQLWLVVARAGGLLALAMAFRLGSRLAGPVAGAVAAVGLALADEFARNAALGNSEPLLVGLALWAVERHLDGRHGHAFALGAAAALLRPEVWPFWGLYGLWLMRGTVKTRVAVLAAGVTVPLLWLIPEYIGSGNFFRAADRAREPNLDSAAFAEHPALEVLERASGVLAVPVLAGAVIALALALRRRDENRALVLALGAVVLTLLAAVAAMTQAGFAGNLRYVALPAALVCVLSGAGWVGLVDLIGRHRIAAAVVLLAAAAPFVPEPVRALDTDLLEARQEARLYAELDVAIARAGGVDRINDCGNVYSGRFEVPAVAWRLRRHLDDVDIFPVGRGHTIAVRHQALARDPRYPRVIQTHLWAVGRACDGF